MKFFVAWSSREEPYQIYDPDANVLVSPVNVPKNWSISRWKSLPKEFFVDSGAFSLNDYSIPSCEEILERQLFMAKGWPSHRVLYFSHPDIIIPPKSSYQEINQKINLSLRRARCYYGLIKKKKVKATPIGVIHGFDEETILSSFYELQDIGYKHFAIGSLAARLSRHREMCLSAIKLALRYDIKPLHVFGVSLPLQNNSVIYPTDSYDSSSPAKLGFYGTVLYGSPLKRYVLAPNAKQKMHDQFFRFRIGIQAPLPCECPICSDDPDRLMVKKGSRAKNDKTIHNYFQLKWATEALN